MLRYFFDCTQDYSGLFEGLKITQTATWQKHQYMAELQAEGRTITQLGIAFYGKQLALAKA